MSLDYLTDRSRAALEDIAERVFTDDLVGLLADEDFSPLALGDEAKSALSMAEAEEATSRGDLWEDDGELYISEDLLPVLTGKRASAEVPAGFTVFQGDTVEFEIDSVRHRGWVVAISADSMLAVHHDDGTDWKVGPEDVTKVMEA